MKAKVLSRLTFIKRNYFYEIMQIIMSCQNCNKIMIVFKIMLLLLKCCNNKQKFLIMRLVFDFSENCFFLNKRQSNVIASDLRRSRAL